MEEHREEAGWTPEWQRQAEEQERKVGALVGALARLGPKEGQQQRARAMHEAAYIAGTCMCKLSVVDYWLADLAEPAQTPPVNSDVANGMLEIVAEVIKELRRIQD